MNISVKELKDINEKKEKFLLLDVRTDAEVSKAVIPINSIHIPMNLIPEKLNTFNKNDNIIVYCKSGVRSKKVCEFLKANENYNKAGYVFLALLSIQFIANLFIESKRSSKFDDDDSDYEQYNDDEETEIDYVDVDGEYDVQNSTLYNA